MWGREPQSCVGQPTPIFSFSFSFKGFRVYLPFESHLGSVGHVNGCWGMVSLCPLWSSRGGRESYQCGFLRDANFRTLSSGKKKDLSFFSLSVHFSIVFISLIWLRFTKMPFMSINPKCFVGSTQVREIF